MFVLKTCQYLLPSFTFLFDIMLLSFQRHPKALRLLASLNLTFIHLYTIVHCVSIANSFSLINGIIMLSFEVWSKAVGRNIQLKAINLSFGYDASINFVHLAVKHEECVKFSPLTSFFLLLL